MIDPIVAQNKVAELLLRGDFISLKMSCWHWQKLSEVSPQMSKMPKWEKLTTDYCSYLRTFRYIYNKGIILLSDYSYDTFCGNFSPKTMQNEWNDKLKGIERLFNQERDLLIANYESLYDQAMEIGRIAGTIEWKASGNPGSPPDSLLVEFGERVRKFIPEKSRLNDQFSVRATRYQMVDKLFGQDALLFLKEISDGFHNRVRKVCSKIFDEQRRYKRIRRHVLSGLPIEFDKLRALNFFDNPEVALCLKELREIAASIQCCDFSKLTARAKDLMAYSVLNFSGGHLEGILNVPPKDN